MVPCSLKTWSGYIQPHFPFVTNQQCSLGFHSLFLLKHALKSTYNRAVYDHDADYVQVKRIMMLMSVTVITYIDLYTDGGGCHCLDALNPERWYLTIWELDSTVEK